MSGPDRARGAQQRGVEAAGGRRPVPAGLGPDDARRPGARRPASGCSDVRVNGAPLDPDKTYTVAIPDFVLRGGDDYTMFAGQRVLISPEAGNLIVTALEKYVAGRRRDRPAVDGRITIGR